MYNSSEEDLFPGNQWINEETAKKMAEVMPAYTYTYNGFDPLKAQVRRAEIYKRALELFVARHNNCVVPMYGPEAACDQYEIDEYINMAKFEVDNAAQS